MNTKRRFLSMVTTYLLFAFIMLSGSISQAQEIFSTTFDDADNWWADGSFTGYNEKSYTEDGWFFHSTEAVRGGADESYGGSSYSFRDREVFTIHNLNAVTGMSGFSLQLRDWMLGGGEQRNLKLSLDGGDSWETVVVINKDWFDAYQVYQQFEYYFDDGIMDFAAEDFMIEIDNGGGSNNGRINIGQFIALGEITQVAKPTFDPPSGTYFEAFQVTLQTNTEGADIYYTLNGNDPTEDDFLFVDPIDVAEDVVIKARAFKDDFDPSEIAAANYTIRSLVLSKDFEDEDLLSGGWMVYDFEADANTWEISQFGGITYAMITEFQSDPEHPHSWYISPEINLNSLEQITFTFYNQAAHRTGDAFSVNISTDYTGSGDPTQATWTELDATLDPHTGSGFGTWTFSDEIDLSDYSGTAYIGFQYESDANNLGRWHINDVLITAVEEGLSDDASLATFTIGGINVLNLGGLIVDDPENDPGATLFVEDFFEFGGIVVEPNDELAEYTVTVNGILIDQEDLEDLPVEFEDVILVTVTAENDNVVYYKVTALGENRILIILTPEEGDEFFTYDDIIFTWQAENISQLIFEVFMLGIDDPVESVVIPADPEEIVEEVPNGIHGTFYYRLTDANDPAFFAESDLFELIDNVDPSLVSKYPASGATDVEINPVLMMEFDEMFIFAGDGGILIEDMDSDDTSVIYFYTDSEYVTFDEGTAIINLPEPLQQGRTYSVMVDENAFADMAGNYFDGILDGTFWTFSTVEEDIPDGIICNGDFENWTGGLPDCWYGDKSNIGTANVVQYDANPYTGTYAAQLINSDDGHKRFTSQATSVESGKTYIITFFIKGQGEIRTGLFDDRETGWGYAPYNAYISVNSDNWIEHSQIITAANTSDIAEFIFSLRNTNEGMGHILIDHVSVVVYEEDPDEVDNIAELRDGVIGNVYKLVGEAYLTFQQDYRNQKFIQDATAAIMIDDFSGIITTEYNIYDGITGIIGTLGVYNEMLQFIPTHDPGPASSENNEVIPEARTLAGLTSNDQAKLVILWNVSFESTGNFETGNNYPLTAPHGTGNFRTTFFDVDYIGEPIPAEPQILTVLVLQNNAFIDVAARSLDDFDIYTDTHQPDMDDVMVYPNPFNENIYIMNGGTIRYVKLYNAQGQLVTQINDIDHNVTIPAAQMRSGLYFLHLHFENGTTRIEKLVKP